MVPTSCNTPLGLSVKYGPEWQAGHPALAKILRPSSAAAVKLSSGLRNGLRGTLSNEVMYGERVELRADPGRRLSERVIDPVRAEPRIVLGVGHEPRTPEALADVPLESWSSSMLALQCTLPWPWAPRMPSKDLVLRNPSPRSLPDFRRAA